MTTENAKQLGEVIRERRHAKGLSLERLADQIGMTHSSISRIETGKFEAPRPDKLGQLAAALDVPYEELFALAGYATPAGLPEPAPYLRAKYRHLPDEALAEAETFFAELEARYEKTPKGGRRGKRAD